MTDQIQLFNNSEFGDAKGATDLMTPTNSFSEMDSLEHGNHWRLPKNSAFIQLDESNSAFIRSGNVVAASISKEFDGWHVNATYERGNYKAFTLFSPEIYPDKEHALAALHDFMERLTEK